MKAPSATIQTPVKHQISITDAAEQRSYWTLAFSVSLEIGAWSWVL
jgi:hypothetical protein